MTRIAATALIALVLSGCATTAPPPPSCEPGEDMRMINPPHRYQNAGSEGAENV